MKAIRILLHTVLIVAFAAFFLPLQALAALPDIIVEVQESGNNAGEARLRAMAKAEQTAFYQLLGKIAKGREVELARKTPASEIAGFIKKMEVVEERSTATSYQAKLRYFFDEVPIQKLLNQTQSLLPGVNSDALLVIPLYDAGDGIKLWEEQNEWRDILNDEALEKGKSRLVMPYGDPRDRFILDKNNVFSTKKEPFTQLAQRYGVRNIVIVLAHAVAPEEGKIGRVDVILRQAGAAAKDDTMWKYKLEGKETFPFDVLEKAAQDIIKKLTRSTESFAVDYNPAEKVKTQVVRIEFTHSSQWQKMRKSFDTLPGIQYVDIGAVSPNFAQVVLYFHGTPNTLRQTLAARGFNVQDDKKYWIVTGGES